MSTTNEDIDNRIRVLCDAIPFFIQAFNARTSQEKGEQAWLRMQELQKEIIALAGKVAVPLDTRTCNAASDRSESVPR